MARLPEAIEIDPEGRRIAFENDHVRVLEVRLPAGREVEMHSHPPRVIVAIASYRLKSIDQEGRLTIVDRRQGEVVWSDGEEHAAEMMTETHAIEVEVKAAR